jgi:hypothetical protein
MRDGVHLYPPLRPLVRFAPLSRRHSRRRGRLRRQFDRRKVSGQIGKNLAGACLSFCLSVHLSVHLSVCLSACLPAWLSVFLIAGWLDGWKGNTWKWRCWAAVSCCDCASAALSSAICCTSRALACFCDARRRQLEAQSTAAFSINTLDDCVKNYCTRQRTLGCASRYLFFQRRR